MITEIDGVRVGHWTDLAAATGCTVVLFPDGTVASGEVRGGAPATRDFDLLDPVRMINRLDAVVISGGSAYGLSASEGVMRYLEEHEVGFATSSGVVPIVVGMSLFDLGEGSAAVRPGAPQGRLAAAGATTETVTLGRVGAGTGATLGKWKGKDQTRPGGLGSAVARVGDLTVAALIAVNAVGDIDDGVTMAEIAAGTFEPPTVEPFTDDETGEGENDADASAGKPAGGPADSPGENTTIGVVVTNATLTKVQCHLVAQSAHDGFARALVPAHTIGDGDAVVAAATGPVVADIGTVRLLAMAVVEAAIRSVGNTS